MQKLMIFYFLHTGSPRRCYDFYSIQCSDFSKLVFVEILLVSYLIVEITLKRIENDYKYSRSSKTSS